MRRRSTIDRTGPNRGRRCRRRVVGAPAAAGDEPALTELRSAAGAALITATTLASTVGFFDANVVNVAVPAISRDLNASLASVQWILTGYLLAVAGLLLVAGALADRFGRRRILIVGLCVMLGASVPCALAPTSGFLVAARVLQGVGGALVVPSSLALLNGTLRVSDRARGIGLWAGLATLGTTVGPFVGGWLVDHASWRWLFFANAPLILGALLALTRVPESTDARRTLSPDVLGGLLAILGLGGVIYALTDGAAHGWLTVRVIVALVGGAGVAGGAGAGRAPAALADAAAVAVPVAAVRRDQRHDRPLLRRARRLRIPAGAAMRAAAGLHPDPGGGGADPGVGRVPGRFAGQRGAGRPPRAPPADGRGDARRRRLADAGCPPPSPARAMRPRSSRPRCCGASASDWRSRR